eukprot:gnl/TRDRNA2_/TRDRNA2_145198_c1_seq1.p3 gnl/TRDRNA2_/TRDRNA2_145198_c1~~gnl/TRDRNA2_/TRDRNA2_145198_c1_seq1.p3  ORF type:complete len:118 (-),score=14.32 gnl/TRDRNA2_/TRDRNA2_145198_c1_seq1:74-427(-)
MCNKSFLLFLFKGFICDAEGPSGGELQACGGGDRRPQGDLACTLSGWCHVVQKRIGVILHPETEAGTVFDPTQQIASFRLEAADKSEGRGATDYIVGKWIERHSDLRSMYPFTLRCQ